MCFGHDGSGALRRSLEEKGVDRRGFLRGALASAAGAALVVGGGPAASAAAQANPLRRPGGARLSKVPPGQISIQLYTLRSVMTGNGVDATLASLADLGYPKVELAGLYGRTPAKMRTTLDELGIRPSSSHSAWRTSSSRKSTTLCF